MKIVVDTNVLVSATWWSGNPRELVRKASEGHVRLIVSDEMFAEYLDVVHGKKFSYIERRSLKEFIPLLIKWIEVRIAGPDPKVIADDPSDDKVLACAKAARADLIVSGDAHLLALGRWAGIRIVSPREAVEMIERAGVRE
jgi:putative PIN family toxin of toxin-antitoxin system